MKISRSFLGSAFLMFTCPVLDDEKIPRIKGILDFGMVTGLLDSAKTDVKDWNNIYILKIVPTHRLDRIGSWLRVARVVVPKQRVGDSVAALGDTEKAVGSASKTRKGASVANRLPAGDGPGTTAFVFAASYSPAASRGGWIFIFGEKWTFFGENLGEN